MKKGEHVEVVPRERGKIGGDKPGRRKITVDAKGRSVT